MGLVSAVISIVSFTYNTYQQIQAVKAQRRAAEEAAKRADAAKGFQLVTDGEAQALGIPFGRNKIGGTRVAYACKSDYVYAPIPYGSTIYNTAIPLLRRTSILAIAL